MDEHQVTVYLSHLEKDTQELVVNGIINRSTSWSDLCLEKVLLLVGVSN